MRNKLWLCLPPVLFCIADQIVTLSQQPHSYWSGTFIQAQEGSPHGEWLLKLHPLAYLAAATAYVVVIAVAVWVLPRLPARTVAVGFVLGHAWGVSTWIKSDVPGEAYWAIIGLFVVAAGLIVTSFELSEPDAAQPR
jgi:hypothetical protein